MLSHEEKPPKPVIQPFSMKQVMSRFDKPTEPSISDLKGEISTLKGEIKNLNIRLDQVELNVLTDQVLKSISPPEKISPPEYPKAFPIIPNDHLREPEPSSFPGSDSPSTSGKAITAIKAYNEHIAVKIVINKDFVLNRVALFDTGADSNCIVKGLVPTKYLQKSTSRLYSATGEKMEIHYQLSKAHVCNNGICLVNDFVITEDITEDIILGIHFTCPRPNGFGRNLHSKTRWFMGFCNSHQVSHFATFFIDARAEISIAESHFFTEELQVPPLHAADGARGAGYRFKYSFALSVPGFVGRTARALGHAHRGRKKGARAECWSTSPARTPQLLNTFAGSFCYAGFDNDPSTGSPTETLLRLLLPLKDKVKWTSRDVTGSEPPTSPRSKHFTRSFDRQIAPPTKNGQAPPPIESRKSSQSVNPYYVWTCAGGTTRPVKAKSASPTEGMRRPAYDYLKDQPGSIPHRHRHRMSPACSRGHRQIQGERGRRLQEASKPTSTKPALRLPRVFGRPPNPRWSTSRVDQGTGPSPFHIRPGRIANPIRFPPGNFKHSLTLFSKSISSFPRGTCSLSVPRPYLALDGIHLPIWAAFPNNPTRRQRLMVRQGSGTTGLSPSLAPPSRGLRPDPPLRTLLQTTTQTTELPDSKAGLFPVRSLLLRESL
ncbi:hypothetical protein FXO38_25404 [Capsicum annuum]|nr:hypothetical protein FXO38_25404 [Capsicum annuum]